MYPKSLENLINSFKKLPGIGSKSAERLALSYLEFDATSKEDFSSSLVDVEKKIKKCSLCNNLTETDICLLCDNADRNHSQICIVENVKDLVVFERLNVYNGIYFILEGLISPIDNIGPNDIGLGKLFNLIENNSSKEVIFAIKPTVESEITMMYIQKKLSNYELKVSKIARGVPVGAEMEYLDSLTLEQALEDRTSME